MGSEMCIRDRAYKTRAEKLQAPALNKEERDALEAGLDADALGGLLLPPI